MFLLFFPKPVCWLDTISENRLTIIQTIFNFQQQKILQWIIQQLDLTEGTSRQLGKHYITSFTQSRHHQTKIFDIGYAKSNIRIYLFRYSSENLLASHWHLLKFLLAATVSCYAFLNSWLRNITWLELQLFVQKDYSQHNNII